MEITRAKAVELHKTLKQVPPDLKNVKFADKITNEAGTFSGTEGRNAIRILARLAHEYDEEEFAKAVLSGEMPPMKLTEGEMELIRGGGKWLRWGVICVASVGAALLAPAAAGVIITATGIAHAANVLSE